jgi:1,4-alpha-glucan branching enzyme
MPPPPSPQPSSRGGMGAVPYATGVTFRVWAPFARAVAVSGDFNAWSHDANPLARDGDSGYWSVDVPGIGAGAQYKYLVQHDDLVALRIDPYARQVTSSVGNGIVVNPSAFDGGDAQYQTPSRNELVIYELHVGSFNTPAGHDVGTFASVEARLDHLRWLGVSAIELMPAMEFATDISWGYNPAHIFAVESAYGGPDGLKALVRAAHARGIAVIGDVVYNHLGPRDLDLWRFDGWGLPGRGGVYFYNDRRAETRWGATRPDYGRREVRDFIADNARMWLDEFRFDGLRWDGTAYLRNVFGGTDPADDIPEAWWLMQRVTGDTRGRQPWKLHIAEDMRGNEWITRDGLWGGAGFHAQWDPQFVHPVRYAVTTMADEARSMWTIRDSILNRFNGDAFQRVIYTESHDEVQNGRARLPEEVWPGNAAGWHARKRSTLAATLVFTAPGLPMIFQGQELLEDRYFRERDPVDWSRRESFAGIVLLYRDLIRLRRNWYDTTRGLRGQHVNVHHVNDADKVIAFHRWDGGGPRDDVVVVMNFSARAFDSYWIGFPRAGSWRVRLNTDWRGYSDDYGDHLGYDTMAGSAPGDGMWYGGNVGLGPYSAVILSQDD